MARRSPTLATALEDWLIVRSAGRGLRPSTTRAYRADMAAVAAELAGPTLDHLVRRWFARAGVPLPRGAAAHAFRHTVAMQLVGRGVAVDVVQALLGHASLSSTQIYIRAAVHHVREAAHALPVRGILRRTR